MFGWLLGIYAFLRLYDYLNVFLIRRSVKGPVPVMKQAEPYSIRKGKSVVLLLHGFTSSPGEFKELANHLYKKNISVHAPLLPGHGTSPERLGFVRYTEWIEFVEAQIALLESQYDSIYLVGNSFGGNLALLSSHKSNKIKGIITLGTPIFFHNEKVSRYILFPLFRRLRFLQKKKYRSERERNIATRKRGVYDSLPLRGLFQMFKVVSLCKKELSNVDKPLLIIQSEGDPITKKESSSYVVSNVRSLEKKVVTLPLGRHFFLFGKPGLRVAEEISSFIKSI